MGRTYELADEVDKQIVPLVNKTIKTFHPELIAAGVEVAVLMAYGPKNDQGNPTDHAIMLGGYRCYATMQNLSLKNRALMRADALLTLDGDLWPQWPAKKQVALVDHELMHLAPKWEAHPSISKDGKILEAGVPKTDDRGRPKLASRNHDWQLGGFRKVIERHGKDAFDWEIAHEFMDEYGQYVFAFVAAAPGGLVNGANEPNILAAIEEMIPDDGSATIEIHGQTITLDQTTKEKVRERREELELEGAAS